MTFDDWWKEMKPAECDELKDEFFACWQVRDAEVAELKAALQAVSDDWDGEHFHNGGSSFMPAVNKALGRGEQ